MFNPSDFANIARTEETFWWFRGMREISFALLDPQMQAGGVSQVLEAGCGTGYFASLLRERYKAAVVAIDLEWEGIRYCRGRQTVLPAQASITALPFPDGAFDLVTNMDVLVHFPEGQEAAPFAELVR